MPETRRPTKRWAAYAAFAVVAFLFALRQTFPVDAIAQRLVLEAAAAGWQVRMADVSPAGVVGIRMDAVTLESADGARIPLDQVTAKLRVLPLLLGRRSIDFDARLWEGRVSGTIDPSQTSRRLVARLEGVNLARATAMRKLLHVDLGGTVRGDLELAVDDRQPGKSTGHLDLSISNAAITGGEVPVAAMGGGALTLPPIGLGTVSARGAVRDGKATFEALSAKGGDDLEADADGLYFAVQPRLAQAPLFGRAQVRFKDAFWQKNGTASLRGIVELALAPARAPDGAYGFQVYGTLSSPQARPAPPPPNAQRGHVPPPAPVQ
jgi:type II secretion system protein N